MFVLRFSFKLGNLSLHRAKKSRPGLTSWILQRLETDSARQTFTVGKWNSWGRRRLCGHLWGLRWNKVLSRYPILNLFQRPRCIQVLFLFTSSILLGKSKCNNKHMLTTYAWFLVNQFPARLFSISWGARRHGLETIVLCGEKHPQSTEENPWSGENRGQVVVGLQPGDPFWGTR